MNLKTLTIAIAISLLLATGACSKPSQPTYKDSVKNALEQADLKDVSVSENAEKNTITLTGTMHSEDAKQKAPDLEEVGGRRTRPGAARDG